MTRTRDAAATRARLLRAARELVCEAGVHGASARKIAARAEVNQALVFYYFTTVSDLVAAASRHYVEAEITQHRDALAAVARIGDLLAVGRAIQEREEATRNVAFMTQILAAAPHDPVIAAAARHALRAWVGAIREPLHRVLAGSPAGELLDLDGLAHLVASGFIGVELYAGSDPSGGEQARDTLARVGSVLDALAG